MKELWQSDDWKVIEETASLPDGRQKTAIRVQRADIVSLLAFPSDSTVLVLREYRPFYGTYIWMLPSGKVDKEDDKDVAAQRELREETGYRSDNLKLYITTNSTEGLISTNYIYTAHGLVHDPLPQDEDELIEVHELPIQEALRNVQESEYLHTASAYALMKYIQDHQL